MSEVGSITTQHVMLSSESDYETAIDQVIKNAERTLHIFDTDLTTGGYSTAMRSEILRSFLMKNRSNRLIIILHETNHLTRHAPHLMRLLQMHSHAITIQQTQEHGRIASDPLVIADAKHYVHRFHADHARALFAVNDPAGGRQLDERFEQLQEASTPAVFADTLGL